MSIMRDRDLAKYYGSDRFQEVRFDGEKSISDLPLTRRQEGLFAGVVSALCAISFLLYWIGNI